MKTSNRLWIGLLMLAVITSGCFEEKSLKPFLLPDLVNSFNRKVEAFDEHNALFVGADGGVLIRYSDLKQYVFDPDNYREVNQINWANSEVFYASSTEIFWLVSDSMIYEFGRDYYEYHLDNSRYYAPASTYFDYAMSSKGQLYRVGYYDERWDGVSFYTDMLIGIYEFVGNPNNTWREYQTEMKVDSRYLSSPYATFDEDDDLIITTNPLFVVREIEENNVVFDSISKTGDNFLYKSINSPYVSSQDQVYGFEDDPALGRPVQFLRNTSTSNQTVAENSLRTTCSIDDDIIGPVKIIDWTDDELRMYNQRFVGANSPSPDFLGEIITYSLGDNSCESKPIRSDGDLLQQSDDIQDIDIMDDEIFIGTKTGLLIYDIETDAITPYLEYFFRNRNSN